MILQPLRRESPLREGWECVKQNELRLYKKRRHFRQSHLTKTVCGIHIFFLVHTRQNSTKIFV